MYCEGQQALSSGGAILGWPVGVVAQPFRCAAAHDKLPRCQVPGCRANLAAEPKLYCLKKRICVQHMQAEALQYPGNQWCRYCFQCAKVEPLTCFDGHKRSCRQALHKRKVRPIIAVKSMMAAAAATAGIHDEALVAGPLYHQSIHQQQQQQQVVVPMGHGGAVLPQLTVTADTVSALSDIMSQTQHVANMLAATRAQLHSGAAAAPDTHETAAVLQPPVGPLIPMPEPVAQAAERQDSSSYSNTSSPVPSNSAAEPGLQAAAGAAAGSGTPTAAAPTATEAEFESLLQCLLFEELGGSGGSMLQASLAGNPTCSSGSASLAGSCSVFPPTSAPTASAGASSGSYASWQTPALGPLLPLQPYAATPAASAPKTSCYPEVQHRQLLPAGPAAAGLVPAAAAAGALPVGLEAASTTARLHALNAELLQVQARLLALVQATQNPVVAGCNLGY